MERRKFRRFTLLADIIILALSFLFMVWTKPASLRLYLPSHAPFFIGLALIWIVVSLLNGKMHRHRVVNLSTLLNRVITSNIIAVAITVMIMFIIRDFGYSRAIVFGTAIIATFLELLFGTLYMTYKKATVQNYENYDEYRIYRKPSEFELVGVVNGNGFHDQEPSEVNPKILKAIEKESGVEMTQTILRMASIKSTDHIAVLSTTTVFNVSNLEHDRYDYIINLHKLNDITRLDEFLDAVNAKLEPGGYFFSCVETKDQRKSRLLDKYPPILNWIYYFFDFIVKRVLPKLKLTKGIYFFLTRGENAVISRAEALGRLCRAGFNIKQESFIGNKLCIEARRTSDPITVNSTNYGAMIALPRVGKNGKLINVYKLRTMHPYSEYIQDYVYRLHDLKDGGKFRNDFRITSWGAVCREIWLDELPMLINFLKGDMKLVGVRPLSQQYFELYRQEVRERRIKYKPGLIPPFYVDMPDNLDEIQASELKYLDAYDHSPYYTDCKYFCKTTWNILFKKARSN